MSTNVFYSLAFSLSQASSAPLHRLALALSKHHGTTLPPVHVVIFPEVTDTSLKTVQKVVHDWKTRRAIIEAIAEPVISAPFKVELSIVDVLVERQHISIGLKALRSRRSTSEPGNRASALFAELHAALLPGIPLPSASSQIFRLYLFQSLSQSPTHHDSGRVEAVDTLDISGELHEGGLIVNGAKGEGAGLEIAGVCSVTVEEMLLLEMSEDGSEAGWKEVGRVQLE